MKEGLTLLLLTAAGPLSLFAQNIDIAEESVRRNKRDVEVRFELETTPKTLKNRYKTEVTPYLYAGTDTLRLPPVEVFGKIRYKRERQEQALAGNPRWALSSRQTMEGTPYRYFAAAPYERWMRTASLGIACRTIGCGCDCYDGDRVVAERIPVYVAPVPYLSDRPAEPEKFEVVDARKRWNFDREEIKVIFPVSKTELLLTEYGNQAALDKIIAGIRGLEGLDTLRLSGVEITGFASPEGSEAFNASLGQGRVEALRDYIRSRVPELEEEDFELINGVENWDGLRQKVAASDLPFRQAVLDIIDNESGEARKRALRKLDGGRPYAYLLRHYYPELRNACYIALYYDVLGDRAADAVNAANADIRAGRYAEALERLEPYRTDERAWNPIGVCCMMLEREEEAIEWFEKAVEAGQGEIPLRNLEQLK